MTHKPAGRRGPTVTSNEAVYQAYVDLHGSDPPVAPTRRAVAALLGVDFRIIDEHTDRLVEKGRIRATIPGSGIFEPVEKVENRAVSFTSVPSGGVKIEIGDQVLYVQNMREGWLIKGLLEGWLKAKLHGNNVKTIPPNKE